MGAGVRRPGRWSLAWVLAGVFAARVLAGAIAGAQPATVVNVGEPFHVQGSHDGLRTSSYTLTIAGPTTYIASLPVAALAGGLITFDVAGLSQAGNYTAVITATGPGGSADSAPFAFAVGVAAPSAVTGIRVYR